MVRVRASPSAVAGSDGGVSRSETGGRFWQHAEEESRPELREDPRTEPAPNWHVAFPVRGNGRRHEPAPCCWAPGRHVFTDALCPSAPEGRARARARWRHVRAGRTRSTFVSASVSAFDRLWRWWRFERAHFRRRFKPLRWHLVPIPVAAPASETRTPGDYPRHPRPIPADAPDPRATSPPRFQHRTRARRANREPPRWSLVPE